VFCWIAPHLIMPASVCLGFSLGTRLCEMRFGYLQGVVFTMNFWNFKVILKKKNHFDVCLKLTCSEKFKQFPWIGLHKCEVMFCWLKRI